MTGSRGGIDMRVFFTGTETVEGFYNDEDHAVIPEGAVEITVEERDAALEAQALGKILCVENGKIVPRMYTELAWASAAAVRATRDSLLAKHVDRFNAIRFESLNGAQQKAWIEYRQALLNVPQQEGFPFDISWPTPPEE